MTKSSSAHKYFQLQEEQTPFLNSLISRVTSSSYSGSPDDFFQLTDVFQDFIKSNEVLEIVNHELEVICKSPDHIPRGSYGSTLLLFETPKVALTAIVLDKRNISKDKIYSAAGDAMFGNVGDEPIPFRFHTIPEDCKLDIFDTSKKLSPQGEFCLAPREVVTIRAKDVVTEYLSTKQTTLIKLTSRLYKPLIWVYDRLSGNPRFSSSGSLQASRLQSAIKLLGTLEAESTTASNESIENLTELTKHPLHFVRWAAVQTLCKIDFTVGKGPLSEAIQDRHPHISKAATNAVQKLKSQGFDL